MSGENDLSQVSSGVPGLDEVLRGGYVTGRVYLVYGRPGTGKTMLGMHFLEAGLADGDTTLFIQGEESRAEVTTSAAELGIEIGDSEFLDLGPDSGFFTEDRSYDLVDPSEIERDRYSREIHETVREIDPDRVVVDPITQLRYVESNEAQFRRQTLAFLRFLKNRDVTVLTTATPSPDSEYDNEIQSLSDGIIELTRGDRGRRLKVAKHRTVGQVGGEHGMEIRGGGVEVFPALVPEQHERLVDQTRLTTGISEFDRLLGGGIERNTVTIISGPTGAGKTTAGAQILSQAPEHGLTATIYLFEESSETFTQRSEAIGIPITDLREQGALRVNVVEPLARSAEEFASMIREDVTERGIDLVMIDGIDGYKMAIQGKEDSLQRKLHALTRYLTNQGVSVVLTDEISEVTGVSSATSSNVSYIADNIVFLSYIEIDSSLQKVIGVLKKRAGEFEHTIRRFELTAEGIHVGEPLTGITGILQGAPRLSGSQGGRDE
jgi:circadian clock protein KaiC